MLEIYIAKWILPANEKVIEKGALIVDNGIIVDVLAFNEINNQIYQGYKRIDLGNSIITPGFINLHTHLQFTEIDKIKPKSFKNKLKRFFLGLKRNILLAFKKKNSFKGWLTALIKEYSCWDDEQKLQSFQNGLQLALKSGTTCIAQLSREEAFFEILNKSPIKSYIFFEVFADSEQASEKSFEFFKDKYNRLCKKCSDSTFIGVSPHSIYTVHNILWKKISGFAREEDILIQAHFAESREEMEWIESGKSDISLISDFVGAKRISPYELKKNPVQYLAEYGLLNEKMILAHVNQLDEKSLKLLANYGVNIAHCPRSNTILHDKTLDIENVLQLFENRVGIGTDSLYSNYDLNMLNEAKFIKTSTTLDLLKILDMLTINAARILRLDHRIGSLKKGKDADFLVFKLENKETFSNLLDKEKPDGVYIYGKLINNN